MYNKTYISTATTTKVSTVKSVLHSIVVGETTAGAITVKDGATTVAVLKASIAEGDYVFDMVINGELSVVTAGASKITVTWKPIA